ncbi:DUF3263 domain-containing protein [Herbiconiux sp. L3-i23]|uniref:DUF3263 domain-containing protein n=1 Tax=Herbiconiux sp. L3-i23 TaxID=2905871 RepID=UPI00206F4D20|nr:DUF3263 domain-containing protein [Herbiconiux sp. L3-i23]BDI23982.1 hypothetical protein L3i23_27580 [Herbiconiux sp. L3-i23]
MDLEPDVRALLDFEDTHPGHTGAKEEGIRVELGLSAARYYQRLDLLLSKADIVAEYPQLASRRLRQRATATARRDEVTRLRRIS